MYGYSIYGSDNTTQGTMSWSDECQTPVLTWHLLMNNTDSVNLLHSRSLIIFLIFGAHVVVIVLGMY